MKRKMTVFAGVLAATALAVSLVGCGGGAGDVKNAEEPVSASQAFNAGGVWFRSSDAPEKDGRVSEVFVFDGAGNVTVYSTSLTYGELNGKTDEEIIEIAKQQDEESFSSERDNEIASLNNAILSRTQANVSPQEGLDMLEEQRELYANDPDALAAIEQEGAYLQEEIDANNEEIQKAKDRIAELEAGYVAPTAQPFTLHVETDGTGNNTVSEELGYGDESLDLAQYSMGWTVYDSYFLGFDGLYTVVEEGHRGFVLDAPGTEGVEVD